MIQMICCKEIEEYLDFYEKSKNVFNKERILLIENIVKPTLEREDVVFDSDTFYKCLKYCEKWYYPLFPYQKFIYAFVFMYDLEDFPLFRTFFIEMGRGNGKDGFICPLVDFLTSQYYGVKNYNIDIVANSESQANDTYLVIHEMRESNKTIMKKYFDWNKEETINKITKSRIRANTSNPKTKDGKKAGAIVFNEYHAYQTNDQITVFQSELGKIKHPRIFIITTNGYVREGPLDEIESVCDGVLHGESNELRYFPFICKLDNPKEVDDPMMWQKANPSIEFMPVLKRTIMDDYLEMQKFPSKRPEFMTKRMNIPQRNEEHYITSWENLLRASYKDVKNKIERDTPQLLNRVSICGIDFAEFTDFASAGFLFLINGELVWRQRTWVCTTNQFFKDIKFPFKNIGQYGYQDFVLVNDGPIDGEEIVDWVCDEMVKYNVKKIILDMYRFKLLKKYFEEKGITIEDNKNPNGIVRMLRFPASIAAIYAPKIEKDFVNGKINFGNSAIMRWAVNNTSTKLKKDGNKVYEKIEPKLRKNDPFMAFVCAISGIDLLEEKVVYAYY